MGRASSIAIAKPIFSALVDPIVLMPTSSPLRLVNGPPESPSLIAASVWMRWERLLPSVAVIVRFKAETMPMLAVGPPSSASALPTEMTRSPTRRLADLPRVMGTRPDFST